MKFFKHNKKLKKIDLDHSNIIYVNGILTSERIATYQKRRLERLLKKQVALIYNPTVSLIKDIIEGVSYATVNKQADVMVEISNIIKQKNFVNKKPLKLIGHSNGVTILHHALKLIEHQLTKSQLSRITFIAMGSPFVYTDLHPLIHVEYFSNSEDPIIKFNRLKSNKNLEFQVYTRDAKGHFLVNDYLLPLKNGEFGKCSVLYKKITDVR